MRITSRNICTVCSALAVLAGIWFAVRFMKLFIQPQQPVFVLKEAHQDLGIVTPGKPIAVAFGFSNSGSQPLIVSDVVTSCGCTAAKVIPNVVNAGSTGRIEIMVNASTSMDAIHHFVRFRTNDPLHQNGMVEVSAKPLWSAMSYPQSVQLSLVKAGSECIKRIEIYSPRGIPFNIVSVQSKASWITVERIRFDTTRHVFDIRVRPTAAGSLNETIEFVTDLSEPSERVVTVPVSGDVISEFKPLKADPRISGENVCDVIKADVRMLLLRRMESGLREWLAETAVFGRESSVDLQQRIADNIGYSRLVLHGELSSVTWLVIFLSRVSVVQRISRNECSTGLMSSCGFGLCEHPLQRGSIWDASGNIAS